MRTILTIILLTAISCDSKKAINITSVKLQDSSNNVGTANADKILNDESPDKVVTDFYHWYLDNYYNSDYKIITPREKIKDGKLYLDTADYMSLIRSCGFFSKSYITGQTKILTTCGNEIQKIDLKDYEECQCSPAEFTKNCDFMLYYNWLFHQGETTTDILIKKSNINQSNATVDIELLSKKGDKKGYQNLRVTLDKEKSGWKISEIANAL